MALIREYFSNSESIHTLEEQLQDRAQPLARAGLTAPQPTEAELRGQLGPLMERQTAITPQAEQILENTLGQVLREQGILSSVGPVTTQFPPVDIHLGPLPKALAISPRSAISLQQATLLRGDMTLEEITRLEQSLKQHVGVSPFVSGLLGVATYPSIVNSGSNAKDLISTVAHEWLHQYFAFHPLGLHYGTSNDMRTMNETAAELGGQEIGRLVLMRLGLSPRVPAPQPSRAPDPSGFSFVRELRATRVQAEAMLAKGQIDEAEAYMEQRRLEFVRHGYYLRVLNQAFFAFNGSYGDSGASVSPIPGELRQLRNASSTIGAFVRTVAGISSPEQLRAAVAALTPKVSAQ